MDGIINLKKEAGMTSHDAVFKLRKILHEKKIGHGGTLDPDVTGVLPIAVGRATRMIEYMQEEGKVYQGQVTLGFSTTTEDASGEVLEKKAVTSDLKEAAIDAVMATFLGEIEQVPPMYSAVKVKGRKLYEYARAGEAVERPKRMVRIDAFERTSELVYEDGCAKFSFRVKCGKGTYVRTLSVDLGSKLGFPAHMSKLVRTGSSGMHLDHALGLEEIAAMVDRGDMSFLQPIEHGIGDLKVVQLTTEQVTEIKFGRFVQLEETADLLAAFDGPKLVAVLEKRGEVYKPRKVLVD